MTHPSSPKHLPPPRSAREYEASIKQLTATVEALNGDVEHLQTIRVAQAAMISKLHVELLGYRRGAD